MTDGQRIKADQIHDILRNVGVQFTDESVYELIASKINYQFEQNQLDDFEASH